MENPILLPTAQAVTLPRSRDFYERQADLARDEETLKRAIAEALHNVAVSNARYAEVMHLIDTWLVEEHASIVDECFPRTRG